MHVATRQHFLHVHPLHNNMQALAQFLPHDCCLLRNIQRSTAYLLIALHCTAQYQYACFFFFLDRTMTPWSWAHRPLSHLFIAHLVLYFLQWLRYHWSVSGETAVGVLRLPLWTYSKHQHLLEYVVDQVKILLPSCLFSKDSYSTETVASASWIFCNCAMFSRLAIFLLKNWCTIIVLTIATSVTLPCYNKTSSHLTSLAMILVKSISQPP